MMDLPLSQPSYLLKWPINKTSQPPLYYYLEYHIFSYKTIYSPYIFFCIGLHRFMKICIDLDEVRRISSKLRHGTPKISTPGLGNVGNPRKKTPMGYLHNNPLYGIMYLI